MSSSLPLKFAERLIAYTPADLKHVFFTNSGSEAVDAAVRFMHLYHNLIGKPKKKKILAREKGYHGATYLCQTITGRERFRPFHDKIPDMTIFLSSPNSYFKPTAMDDKAFLQFLIDEVETAIKTHGADIIGAFIAEPLQASGGVIAPPKGYLKAMRDICTHHQILYISDEVVTAFGRMGEVIASHDYFGIVPDIITTAKAITAGYIPMGAFFVSDRLYRQIAGAGKDNNKGSVFTAGFTFSGNPMAAAAGMKALDILEDEKILAHVKNIVPYFQQKLRGLQDIPIVGDIRGEGLLGCIELVADRKSDKDDNALLALDVGVGSMVDNHCYELGLLVRPLVNLCIMSPPLIIQKPEIDKMINILREGVERTMTDLKKQGVIG